MVARILRVNRSDSPVLCRWLRSSRPAGRQVATRRAKEADPAGGLAATDRMLGIIAG